MGTEQTGAAAGAAPGDRAGDAGLTLAGLIDVLDRADDALGPRRARPRRVVVHRSPAVRVIADRWHPLREFAPRVASRPLPLRSVRPAPPARAPAPGAEPSAPVRPAAELRRGPRARLRALVRRAALWGAGPDGAHLAWGASPLPPPPVHSPPVHSPDHPRPIRRRAAGRGPVEPPVVLRELPDTPTNRPAASSPAAAPPAPAPRVERAVRPGTAGRLPAPLPVRRGPVPSRARSPGGGGGSSGTAPARGSPPWRPHPG